jgi:hypothetical protein
MRVRVEVRVDEVEFFDVSLQHRRQFCLRRPLAKAGQCQVDQQVVGPLLPNLRPAGQLRNSLEQCQGTSGRPELLLCYDRDLAFIRFAPSIWQEIRNDLDGLRSICERAVESYYDRLNTLPAQRETSR